MPIVIQTFEVDLNEVGLVRSELFQHLLTVVHAADHHLCDPSQDRLDTLLVGWVMSPPLAAQEGMHIGQTLHRKLGLLLLNHEDVVEVVEHEFWLGNFVRKQKVEAVERSPFELERVLVVVGSLLVQDIQHNTDPPLNNLFVGEHIQCIPQIAQQNLDHLVLDSRGQQLCLLKRFLKLEQQLIGQCPGQIDKQVVLLLIEHLPIEFEDS